MKDTPILDLSTAPPPPIGVTVDKTFYRLRQAHELGIREIKAIDAATAVLARLLLQGELTSAEEATVDTLVRRVCAIALVPNPAALCAVASLSLMQRTQLVVVYLQALHRSVPGAVQTSAQSVTNQRRPRVKAAR